MKSKFTEAFDSLESDEKIRSERAKRVLSKYDDGQAAESIPQKSECIAKPRFFASKRAVALITAAAVFVAAVGIAVPVGMHLSNGRSMLDTIALLKGTYVDMEGVSAFGVWNAPDSVSESAYVSNVSRVKESSFTDESTDENGGERSDGDEISSGDWSDEDRYEWESDYEWDPTKANVLIAIGDDGSISEVVYERTNGRGQVRQDVLGNAAKVYVSNGFTYVMYVDDAEWRFWMEIEYAQQVRTPNGFSCHHERMQTVVIHNETGKVFALNDIIPQVNELSNAVNRTLQVDPFKDDVIHIKPMYGNYKSQWYNVIFDENTQELRYELVLPKELAALYNIRAVRRDKYGQQFLLTGKPFGIERVSAGIVNLPDYTVYDNSLIFEEQNGLLFGSDGRVYAFDNGVLKVFGEDFRLEPVAPDTEVVFEGIADAFGAKLCFANDGINYTLANGYLFSMFGEVWKVSEHGNLSERDRLAGSFPRYADDGYLIGGEVIAFVDTSPIYDDMYSVNGRMVQIKFDVSDEDSPKANIIHILSASEISCNGTRMLVEQNERPYTSARGDTKYFLITVVGGTPMVEYVAYGRDGGMLGVANPITEPLVQT